MKKAILLCMIFLAISCTQDSFESTKSEASLVSAQKGKPVQDNFFKGGIATQDIVIDGSGYNLTFKNFNIITYDSNPYIYFTNYFNMKRETLHDEFNMYFKEETNSRDLNIHVGSAVDNTELFMDANRGSSNFTLTANSNRNYKQILANNAWFEVDGIPSFETVDEARAAGHFGMFKTSDGTIKTTQ